MVTDLKGALWKIECQIAMKFSESNTGIEPMCLTMGSRLQARCEQSSYTRSENFLQSRKCIKACSDEQT